MFVFTLTGCATDRRAEIAKETLYGWHPLSSPIRPVTDPVFTAALNQRFPARSTPNAVGEYVKAMGGGCSVLGGGALASFGIKVEESKKMLFIAELTNGALFVPKRTLKLTFILKMA